MTAGKDDFQGRCAACGASRAWSEIEGLRINGMKIWVCKDYLRCRWRQNPVEL